MAALTNSIPFKSVTQSCSRRASGCPRRALACRAQAEEHGWQRNVGVQLLAAGLAATALVASPSIADAKVVLEQPKVKKVFQGGGSKPTQPQESSEGGGISGGGLSLPSISGPDLSGLNFTPGETLNPRLIALPGAILGIGAAGFAAFQLDSGFRGMMREALVKDSTGYAGYEEVVKSQYTPGARAVGKGTKKISKAVAPKAKGKGGGGKGGLGGLFGKK